MDSKEGSCRNRRIKREEMRVGLWVPGELGKGNDWRLVRPVLIANTFVYSGKCVEGEFLGLFD